MTPKTRQVLDALRTHVEGRSFLSSHPGREFGQVYLDNAIPTGMSRRAFAGHLSVLERLGLYKPQGDDCFGDVALKD